MKNKMLSILWIVGVGLGVCQAGVVYATNSCPNDDELMDLCNQWLEVQSQWNSSGIWPIAEGSAEAVLVEQLEYLCVTTTTTRSSNKKSADAEDSGSNPGGSSNGTPLFWGGYGAMIFEGLGPGLFDWAAVGKAGQSESSSGVQDSSTTDEDKDSNKKDENKSDSKTGYNLPFQY